MHQILFSSAIIDLERSMYIILLYPTISTPRITGRVRKNNFFFYNLQLKVILNNNIFQKIELNNK